MLFAFAISKRFYVVTLPYGLLDRVFGEDAVGGPLGIRNVLRKIYSIIAFALVGYVVDRALPRTARAGLRAALIVAAFSAVIEVGQKLHHAREGLASNIFDVGCGALGGWLGAELRRRTRRRRPERGGER